MLLEILSKYTMFISLKVTTKGGLSTKETKQYLVGSKLTFDLKGSTVDRQVISKEDEKIFKKAG